MAWPAARSLAGEEKVERPSYEDTLAGNQERLLRIIDMEMGRADRYHHPFSVIVIRVPVMNDMFGADEETALRTADEVQQGIQTRTRRSDYGCWIRPDTYAMASLEGSGRIQFLVSRLVAYLHKDLSQAGVKADKSEVLVGAATYPGTARTPDALLDEAERNLKSHPAP